MGSYGLMLLKLWGARSPEEVLHHGSRVGTCSGEDKSTQDWISEEYDQCGPLLWLRLVLGPQLVME